MRLLIFAVLLGCMLGMLRAGHDVNQSVSNRLDALESATIIEVVTPEAEPVGGDPDSVNFQHEERDGDILLYNGVDIERRVYIDDVHVYTIKASEEPKPKLLFVDGEK